MIVDPAAVHVLLLEDSAVDTDLLESHLQRSGLRFSLRRATGRRDYLDAIEAGRRGDGWQHAWTPGGRDHGRALWADMMRILRWSQ